MRLEYRKAVKEDAELIVHMLNAAFYGDYVRYGECPAYGRSKENMEESIQKNPRYIVSCEGTPAGMISYSQTDRNKYYIGCLCVIPEYQGRGIGTKLIKYMMSVCPDWNRINLITPADKEENIRFYKEKCGFQLGETTMDGNVEVVEIYKERYTYKDCKEFSKEQLQELFLSVKWESGNYPEKLMKAMRQSTKVISAWDGDQLIGLIRALDDGVTVAFIHYLLVNPKYQGKHIGNELMKRLLSQYEELLYIKVIPSDPATIPFYKRFGFQEYDNYSALVIKQF